MNVALFHSLVSHLDHKVKVHIIYNNRVMILWWTFICSLQEVPQGERDVQKMTYNPCTQSGLALWGCGHGCPPGSGTPAGGSPLWPRRA